MNEAIPPNDVGLHGRRKRVSGKSKKRLRLRKRHPQRCRHRENRVFRGFPFRMRHDFGIGGLVQSRRGVERHRIASIHLLDLRQNLTRKGPVIHSPQSGQYRLLRRNDAVSYIPTPNVGIGEPGSVIGGRSLRNHRRGLVQTPSLLFSALSFRLLRLASGPQRLQISANGVSGGLDNGWINRRRTIIRRLEKKGKQ